MKGDHCSFTTQSMLPEIKDLGNPLCKTKDSFTILQEREDLASQEFVFWETYHQTVYDVSSWMTSIISCEI